MKKSNFFKSLACYSASRNIAPTLEAGDNEND